MERIDLVEGCDKLITFFFILCDPQLPGFAEEAARKNDRGNLPLHAACSFQPTPEVVDILVKAYPDGPKVGNNIGNLPLHQAAMWQASLEVLDLLLSYYPEGAAVRNTYGSLPLHMAASNQAKPECVRRLIEVFPESAHMQNDDGMTPLDLVLADEAPNETVVAMLEGRPPPPVSTPRVEAERYAERAEALERKLAVFQDSSGRQRGDLDVALLAVRKLADCIPHALYVTGMDPNELEAALSSNASPTEQEDILLAMVKKAVRAKRGGLATGRLKDGEGTGTIGPIRDRVEDLLDTLVGLGHIKSQVRFNLLTRQLVLSFHRPSYYHP
jgi:ankyrin repeat protein